MEKFKGNKTELIKGQEQRAIAILEKVKEKEFPAIDYQVDDHAAIWERKLLIDAASKMRASELYFMDSSGLESMYIYTDEALEKHARFALTELLLSEDP